jgi:flagellar biosynthetic protein FliR
MNALSAIDPFAPGAGPVLALFGARMSGLVLVAPVFSARTIPVMVRTALVVLLTVLLAPVAMSYLTEVPAITPATVITEALIGFAIGLGAAVFVGAAEAAGDVLSVQIGLSGAAIVDPLNNQQGAALGPFLNMFAVVLLLTLNGHFVMLDAVAASVRHLPLGSAANLQAGMGALISLGTTLFTLGLRFAAPVVAVVLIANVALAVLSRAAPQLNILSIAFPIQIGLGLFVMAAALPLLAHWFNGWDSAYDGVLDRIFGALAPAKGR